MSLAKKIKTLELLIDTFSYGNISLEEMARKVKGEWSMEQDATHVVQDESRAQLNRVLHATRAFDTSLRLFLDKYGSRSPNSHSIMEYVGDLQRNAVGFKKLSGTIATNIKTEVADERNKYCHASGAFPSKQEADFLISRILHYYTLILGLV